MRHGDFELSIIPGEGHGTLPLAEYLRERDRETYIAGVRGERYSLKLANHSNRRVLAVATVDGLSVMDGQTGDLHKSSGYVLAPYQTAIIPGWRLNNQDVAAFRFSFPGDSYAAKIGKPTNLGVIGCAFFEEVVKPLFTPSPYPSTPHPFPYQPFLHDWHGTSIEYGEQVRSMYTTGGGRGSSMGSANVVHSYNNSPSLGTEFGERREHRVVTTSFDRQGAPAVVLTIRYETHLRLQEMGITSSTPAAFTSYAGVGATPPAGWRG